MAFPNADNICIFSGRLTKDPEEKRIGSGKNEFTKISFSLAVRVPGKDESIFINCSYTSDSDKALDAIMNNWSKGDGITVQCVYAPYKYEKDGEDRWFHDFQVVAWSFGIGKPKGDDDEDNNNRGSNRSSGKSNSRSSNSRNKDDNHDSGPRKNSRNNRKDDDYEEDDFDDEEDDDNEDDRKSSSRGSSSRRSSNDKEKDSGRSSSRHSSSSSGRDKDKDSGRSGSRRNSRKDEDYNEIDEDDDLPF